MQEVSTKLKLSSTYKTCTNFNLLMLGAYLCFQLVPALSRVQACTSSTNNIKKAYTICILESSNSLFGRYFDFLSIQT